MKKLLLLIVLCLPVLVKAQLLISTIVGDGTPGYLGDGGPATAAEINFPGFICFGIYNDSYGSIFIGDRLNYRIRQVKLGSGGNIITTIAGNGTPGFSGDGGPATAARMGIPGGVTVNGFRDLFFCDYDNHRIRKVDMFGTITTIAGTGTAGFSGDGGPATAAQFNYPLGITVDLDGNLFIADQHNHRIRKIDTGGIITTVVGTGVGGSAGDGGPATSAQISFPNYIRKDATGNLYVTDNGSHKIRKVDATTGIISTVAGTGSGGFSGDGGPATAAQLLYPGGIAIDGPGNLFITDCYNHRIREVMAGTGIIGTVAGTGVAGYSGDGGPATAAQLNQPVDIAVDLYGWVYVIDWNNSRVRIFRNSFTLEERTIPIEVGFEMYPNPANDELTIASLQTIRELTITNIVGQQVYTKKSNDRKLTVSISSLPKGVYLIRVNEKDVKKFVKN